MLVSFIRGLLSNITETSVSDGRIGFATDTDSLFIDVSSTRHTVKDPTAGKSLEIDGENKLIKLKNQSSTVISTIDLHDFIEDGFQVCNFTIEHGDLIYNADTAGDITSENFLLDEEGVLWYIA